jgi:hypothetical protein
LKGIVDIRKGIRKCEVRNATIANARVNQLKLTVGIKCERPKGGTLDHRSTDLGELGRKDRTVFKPGGEGDGLEMETKNYRRLDHVKRMRKGQPGDTATANAVFNLLKFTWLVKCEIVKGGTVDHRSRELDEREGKGERGERSAAAKAAFNAREGRRLIHVGVESDSRERRTGDNRVGHQVD